MEERGTLTVVLHLGVRFEEGATVIKRLTVDTVRDITREDAAEAVKVFKKLNQDLMGLGSLECAWQPMKVWF